MAPRILIFSIAMGADHSFYVKTIETHACAFLPLNISAIDTVIWAGQAEQQAWVMLPTPARKKAQEKLIAYCSNTYTVHWTESEMQTVAEFKFPKADSCPAFQ